MEREDRDGPGNDPPPRVLQQRARRAYVKSVQQGHKWKKELWRKSTLVVSNTYVLYVLCVFSITCNKGLSAFYNIYRTWYACNKGTSEKKNLEKNFKKIKSLKLVIFSNFLQVLILLKKFVCVSWGLARFTRRILQARDESQQIAL